MNQETGSANPALDLQRNQGMIFARRHHHHDGGHSDSSFSIMCSHTHNTYSPHFSIKL